MEAESRAPRCSSRATRSSSVPRRSSSSWSKDPVAVLEPVSVGLKYGFLIVLYLFLMWVAWSALRDLRRGRGGLVQSDRGPSQDATGMYDAASSGLVDLDEFEPRLLVDHASGHQSGWPTT